jgi:hypothetical protein
MGVTISKKHVLSENKIVNFFVQGQWVGVKLKGIYNLQIA